MLSHQKNLSFLTHLQHAFASDEVNPEQLSEYLSSWTAQYKEIYQELFALLKREKASSPSILLITDPLKSRLIDQLPESDLLKILTESLIFSYVLKEDAWQNAVKNFHLSFLQPVVAQLKTHSKQHSAIDKLITLKGEVSTYLPAHVQPLLWQFLHHAHQYQNTYPIFSEKAITTLSSFSNYLFKRKLGLSFNDEETQILWMNATSHRWVQNLLYFVEPDLQVRTLADKTLSYQTDLVDFIISAHISEQSNSGLAEELPFYWQDPLNETRQGLQTNLFSEIGNQDKTKEEFLNNTFSFIGADISQPHHPYRYGGKSIQNIDQRLSDAYQAVGISSSTVSYLERMVHRAVEKLADTGLVILVLPASVLDHANSHNLRQFLKLSFHQIYALDIWESQEERLCLLYLVKKSKKTPEKVADIHYAQLSLTELHDGIEFEFVGWQIIRADQQDYWKSMPESDFFDLHPIFGTAEAIFKRNTSGISSSLDAWLMDDDPKLLEKKVKQFFKLYSKGKKQDKELNTEISWPPIFTKLAEAGVELKFDKQKIKKIWRQPFVHTYFYAEGQLDTRIDEVVPSIAYDFGAGQVYPLSQPAHYKFFDRLTIFPVMSDGNKPSYNISEESLRKFRTHYQLRTKAFDQNFIVFPPEDISTILDKIESVSRDLPGIRKYPNQISQMLAEARHFTSDVELLTPPYEKIDEFKRKVLRLEKDAIERKVIYQRVKSYIEELKEQLATLTREHDEAQKEYEAVNEENIFYYTFAVLHDPDYKKKYGAFLIRDFPRIPLYPTFRQWATWGKQLFSAYGIPDGIDQTDANLLVKEEISEEVQSKSLTYSLDQERGIIVLKEQFSTIAISNVPREVWEYQFEGKSPLMHYLDDLTSKSAKKRKKNKLLNQTNLLENLHVVEHIQYLCHLSGQVTSLGSEIQETYELPTK